MKTMSTRLPVAFDDIRYFVEVAQVGNITRAAERLGIRQPSLSAAMQRLEGSLATELLIRGRVGVELTREGKLFFGRAKVFLNEWSELERAVHQHGNEPVGSFSIGAHPTIALHWLPTRLVPLLKRWPLLELTIRHDLSRRITEQVVSHELDFGVVVNPVRHPDLVISELGTDVFTAWSRPAGQADTVLCDPDLLQTQQLLRRLEKKGLRFRRTVSSSNLELLAQLAAHGAGVALLPTHLAQNARPTLKPISGDAPSVLDSVCLVYRADAQRTVAAKALVAGLKRPSR